ncbi:MAG TPA: hypothetical protein DEF47_00425 [Herpetosiphon sp.]|uniref:Uncharacterized protein n=1 Tax=Herpetosiphon aurantiacus (strain ATCC 23779 / DSM 785 / 114-95) TaxID=316274 RepID=A9B4L5_HERA2|nr:hypothetical protein [Herpetosiphon sp.]ABX04180.1 hypothetical protein Haur_1536 [Herpetosiphon aurantiacus DSM 785]HBW48353.1 hypothetical protein [Herpetosiphon sp.]
MHVPSQTYNHARNVLTLLLIAQGFLLVWASLQRLIAPQLIGFPYSPNILSLTHLITLGWASLICLAALYQLLPVLLQQPLAWRGMVDWSFGAFVVGSGLFSWAFSQAAAHWLISGAVLLSLGLLGILASYGRTLWVAQQWDVTTIGISLALTTLTIQLLIGIALVINRSMLVWPSLVAYGPLGHATLGVLGWFSTLTLALSYRLLPMFTLAHGYVCRWRWVAVLSMNFAAYATGLALWYQAPQWIMLSCVSLIVLSISAWLADVQTILKHRIRRHVESPIKLFVVAGAWLLICSGWAIAASLGWLSNSGVKQFQVLFMAAMQGWIGLAIMTMLHKIIPFLIWIARANNSKQHVPSTARELFWPQLSSISIISYGLGSGLAIIAVVINNVWLLRLGSGLIAASAMALLLNCWHGLRLEQSTKQIGMRL